MDSSSTVTRPIIIIVLLVVAWLVNYSLDYAQVFGVGFTFGDLDTLVQEAIQTGELGVSTGWFLFLTIASSVVAGVAALAFLSTDVGTIARGIVSGGALGSVVFSLLTFQQIDSVVDPSSGWWLSTVLFAVVAAAPWLDQIAVVRPAKQ